MKKHFLLCCAIIAPMLSATDAAAQSGHLYPSDLIDFNSFGADPTGVADSTAALQSYIDAKILAAPSGQGYIAVLPPGTFLISSTLNLCGTANTYSGAFGLQGMPGGATIITGSVSGYLVRRIANATTKGPSTIRDIHFINSVGGCVSVGGVVGLNVSGCQFNSHGVMFNTSELGTSAPDNTFNVSVHNCTFLGAATLAQNADAIGILSHGQTDISGCDFTLCAEGVRLSGTGFTLTGSRFEVNKIGMNLGVRETGATWALGRAFFGGLSFEANDTAIYIKIANSTDFSGIQISGSVNSPSGGSQIGIDMEANAGFNVTIGATQANGSYAVAAIKALDKRAVWINCSAGNIAGGIDWVLPSDEVFNDHFINCTGLVNGTDLGQNSRLSQTVAITGTSYTMRDDNRGKVVTFNNATPVAVALPQAGQFSVGEQYYKFDQNWQTRIVNLGAGLVTITPTISTINGLPSASLKQYESINIFSDRTNYYIGGH